MRKSITVLIFLGIFVGVALLVQIGTAAASNKEVARIEFTETVKIGDVLLRGEYLVIHDDQRMAAGWPCMALYRGDATTQPVYSYHCKSVPRGVAERFTVRTQRIGWNAIPEVVEIQFAGSSSAHHLP